MLLSLIRIEERFGTLLQHEWFHLKPFKCYLSYALVAARLSYRSSNISATLGSKNGYSDQTLGWQDAYPTTPFLLTFSLFHNVLECESRFTVGLIAEKIPTTSKNTSDKNYSELNFR